MRSTRHTAHTGQPDEAQARADAEGGEIDHGSPFDAAYGVPEELIPLLPAPLSTLGGPLAPPPSPRPIARIALLVVGTIAVATILALLLAQGN